MTDLYLTLLKIPGRQINGKIFNAGYENNTVSDLGKIVKESVGDDVNLIFSKTDDNRSYHISSDKIKDELNFHAKHSINEAVLDLVTAFKNKILIDPLNNEMYFNIKRMNNINLK